MAACLLFGVHGNARAQTTNDARGEPTRVRYLSGTGKDDAVVWDFYCTAGRRSGVWSKIPVPSNWEQQGFGGYNFGRPFDEKKNPLAREQGRYRFQFSVPANWKGKVVRIVFEGVMTDAEVSVNGKSAGPTHQGSFYQFKYDISSLLKYGAANLLEVNVSKVSANESVNRGFGFRTFEVRAGDGLYLNGQRIILKGTNRHSFWPESGRTTSRQLSYSDARLLKEMNNNAVRMSHYPLDAHFLEACDELGLYVLDELGGWQRAYDTETGRKLIGELVRRDVNHPSILFWDNGNEGGWNRENDVEFAKWDP